MGRSFSLFSDGKPIVSAGFHWRAHCLGATVCRPGCRMRARGGREQRPVLGLLGASREVESARAAADFQEERGREVRGEERGR
jgi:hypothetical protein